MNRALVSDLLGISEKSYYRWKEERKIFALLEKYFTDDDIKNFLETGNIEKQDRLKELLEIEEKYKKIIEIIDNKN